MNERSTNSNKGQKAAQRSIRAKLTSIGADFYDAYTALLEMIQQLKNIIDRWNTLTKAKRP